MDRPDLIIDMRMRLGDWFKVERLVRERGGDDTQLVHAWNKIGQYYSDRHKWLKAAQFYTQVWGTTRTHTYTHINRMHCMHSHTVVTRV